MRLQRNKKFICTILSVLLLFCGMYLEKSSVDSLFSYDFTSPITAGMESGASSVLSTESCTQEMLGTQGKLSSFREAKRPALSTSFKTSLTLSTVELTPHHLHSNLVAEALEISNDIPSHTVILDYIHQQDGKKS